MKYFMKSLATATFFAPFGMKPPPAPRKQGMVCRHCGSAGPSPRLLVVRLLVLDHREFGRQRAIEIHHEQLLVIGVVVVGVVPAQRLRRDVAFLVELVMNSTDLIAASRTFGSSVCSLPSLVRMS